MNPYERTTRRLREEPADRLPVHPLFMIHAADVVGVKHSDYVRDFRGRARLHCCAGLRSATRYSRDKHQGHGRIRTRAVSSGSNAGTGS